MRPRPLHRPTRTIAAQNRPAACVPRGSAADRARLSDRAGRGVPPAGATALPAPSRLEIYRAASASFCRRTPPRQNSPDAASICLRHNTGQMLPNPGSETGLFQRILRCGAGQVKRGKKSLNPASCPMDGQAISFGPFRLLAAQRLLLEGDQPVRLGSRAFDILATLVERPGEVIGKDELKTRIWPKTFVEDSNLK